MRSSINITTDNSDNTAFLTEDKTLENNPGEFVVPTAPKHIRTASIYDYSRTASFDDLINGADEF